jgi:hypothetical protein
LLVKAVCVKYDSITISTRTATYNILNYPSHF